MRLKLLLAGIALTTLSGHIYACKCEEPGTVKESYTSSSIVVHGKVISIKTVSFAKTLRSDKEAELRKSLNPETKKIFDSDLIFEVRFQVVDRFKGSIADTLTVFTPVLGASCGYRFEVGGEYIIYGSVESILSGFFLTESQRAKDVVKERTYWTHHCTRTRRFSKGEADELDKLKKQGP